MSKSVRLDRHPNGVATVTLARPEVNNAFDDTMIGDLANTLCEVGDDSGVQAVVLAGEGRSFCAGADVAWMKRAAAYSRSDNLADATNLAMLLHALDRLPKTTIARVQGAVYGGGVGLIACCDIVIASTDARFCLSEVRLGLVPAVISPHVVAAIGARSCRRLFQTAEVFNGQEAQRLDDRVAAILADLRKGAPQAKAAAKALVRSIAQRPIDETVRNETAALIAELRVGAEAQEGLAAFLGKRQPAWL
jgi:methylglutaconyl-CoA hydratase